MMAGHSGFRDSTQIVLPWKRLDGVHSDLESKFTVTVHDEGTEARIIGSPVVIKEVSDFLVHHGISLP
ncbi:MAG: hypothetical protein ACI80F_002356 [Natronomonas sp.]|jgi:hypothetical protein|uniref:VNG_1110C family protein n=1 Tax=Natronomonas sp. TaxID=2184060 RepID=UPI00398A3837